VHTDSGNRVGGRLIIVRRSKQATEYTRKKLRQEASKKQKSVSAETLEAAQYFLLWTTLPRSRSRKTVLELYRCRWQIELAFKRMKSIMGLGHLPKKDPESCRAWWHGKWFTSLLVERMILDQPPASLDLHAMLRDTLAALNQLPEACARFRTNLPRRAQSILAQLEITVRRSLCPTEAYSMVPGRSPQNG
jgi:hypothetical protein